MIESICTVDHFMIIYMYSYMYMSICIGSNCPPLSDPDNGSVHHFPDGVTAVFTCKNGFTTNGESLLRCINGQWSAPPPTCLQP